jgi:hypothetical protein
MATFLLSESLNELVAGLHNRASCTDPNDQVTTTSDNYSIEMLSGAVKKEVIKYYLTI